MHSRGGGKVVSSPAVQHEVDHCDVDVCRTWLVLRLGFQVQWSARPGVSIGHHLQQLGAVQCKRSWKG